MLHSSASLKQKLDKCFSKEDLWQANKHEKRDSAQLAVRKIQINFKHDEIIFHATTMVNIKERVNNTKFGAAETFTHCWWECTKVDQPQKTQILRMLCIYYLSTLGTSNSTCGYLPKLSELISSLRQETYKRRKRTEL